MICYVRIRLQADSPAITVTPFLTETEAFSGPTPTLWSSKSTIPIFHKPEDPCETPPILFSLFSSLRHFDDKDVTVGSMVIDCGNGIIKKEPDAERESDVCNEDLGTDENTGGDIHDQEDSTSEEFEAEENVEEDIRSDLDEQGNAISDETEKVTEANVKNHPDEELDLFSKSMKFPTKGFLRQFIRQNLFATFVGRIISSVKKN